ncbi:MAG: aminotransferase class IV [Ectothiorhodospiraceae bacterium]|nr:aminotransferase class IV [Ectothiorhodospiraceae bacterium]MCH8503402.1 aminotransferase class IV [Ectothiorhodospiraceae bacterium]
MSAGVSTDQAQINGHSITLSELIPLAFAGFAHFTALQVRDRRIKGLDLHLDRLRKASVEFFGRALPDEQIRSYMKTAIDKGPEDQSLTVTVFSRNGEFTADSMDVVMCPMD